MSLRLKVAAAHDRVGGAISEEALVEHLQSSDSHTAWGVFYEQYRDVILRYAQRRGLNFCDAEDVLQDAMLTLFRLLPDFTFDPRRGKLVNFVLTIVHRKMLSLLRRASKRYEVVSLEQDPIGFTAVEEGESAVRAGAEALWQKDVFAEALRRVQNCPRIGERTFAVFDAYVLQCRSVSFVAREYGMNRNAVYQIRNRLLKRVAIEVAKLLQAERMSWQQLRTQSPPR